MHRTSLVYSLFYDLIELYQENFSLTLPTENGKHHLTDICRTVPPPPLTPPPPSSALMTADVKYIELHCKKIFKVHPEGKREIKRKKIKTTLVRGGLSGPFVR